MCHHDGGNPAGTDDRHLWRYNHETAEAPADHAEIRQCDGRPPKFFRWNRAGDRVGPQPVEPGSQVPYVALGDVAHHRHDEAALGIDRDTNIDALDQTPGARAGIVPGVERGLRPAGSRNCAHQADTCVFARSPLVDISVVADGSGTTSACAAAIRWAMARRIPRNASAGPASARLFAARSTSARVMVPPGPVACTALRSTSSLRARARTAGST